MRTAIGVVGAAVVAVAPETEYYGRMVDRLARGAVVVTVGSLE